MSTSHQDAIQANIKAFNADVALEYDKREATQVLSLLFTKTLLEFEVNNSKRKSLEESSKILGDPNKINDGFTIENTLPNPKTFLSEHPHTLFKPGIKLLDFACGSGVVTQHFAPYLSSEDVKSEIVGIDINPNFLSKFDEKAETVRSSQLSIKSYLYDILDPKLNDEIVSKFGNTFDVVICTSSYHHIDNYREVTKKLATFLRPGGWLFIIDFYNEDVERTSDSSNGAVRHMGGLKVDALNDTLGNFCKLVNVSSARELRVYLWQAKSFIENHLTQEIIFKLHNNELKSKKKNIGDIEYLVETSIILSTGQKPSN